MNTETYKGYARARILRKRLTEAEQIMWDILRSQKLGGYKFRRQHPIGPYVVDFYCAKNQVVIELDGQSHNDIEIRKNDDIRTRYLGGRGIRVIRFLNAEVKHLPGLISDRILSELNSLIPLSPSPLGGEGLGVRSP